MAWCALQPHAPFLEVRGPFFSLFSEAFAVAGRWREGPFHQSRQGRIGRSLDYLRILRPVGNAEEAAGSELQCP